MNDCSCESCQKACMHKPGWFMPGQAEKVAGFLGISLQELFDQYLGVDWWYVADQDIFVLAPAIVGEETGSEYPGNPSGMCVFFDGECTIHAVKPFDCREYFHDQSKEEVMERKKAIKDAWNKDKCHQQIVELLGREPKSEFWIPYGDGFNSLFSLFSDLIDGFSD